MPVGVSGQVEHLPAVDAIAGLEWLRIGANRTSCTNARASSRKDSTSDSGAPWTRRYSGIRSSSRSSPHVRKHWS